MNKHQLIIVLMLIGFSSSLKAQQLQPPPLQPFNEEEYNKKLPKIFPEDSLRIQIDTIVQRNNMQYPMRVIEVPKNQMAPMPQMNISSDIHYHMQIKEYENCYDPEKPSAEKKLPPNELGEKNSKN